MIWSPQQETALREVKRWLNTRNDKQVFRLFGYAGTGKTQLAKALTDEIKGTVLYGAFTGKAALQLRKKGCGDAQTLHSMIYKSEVDESTGEAVFTLNQDCELSRAKLLVVDEVSMVDKELADDLMSFGKRILVLGDPAQLPPVNGEGFFINAAPDVMLTEVHRQARDNPITRMSMDVREGKRLQRGHYGESMVICRDDVSQEELREMVLDADQVLCGMNKTRAAFNSRIRHLKGLAGDTVKFHPAISDRLICLRNDREKRLFNGGLWDVHAVADKMGRIDMVLGSLDESGITASVQVREEFFCNRERELEWRERRGTQEFAFGWAITVHKSQGSEWSNVIVFDESGTFRESRDKWLYTAITRAAEKVTVVQ